jgi:hypothetical protein
MRTGHRDRDSAFGHLLAADIGEVFFVVGRVELREHPASVLAIHGRPTS